MADLQELYGTLEIALVLVEATGLGRFNQSTLQPQHELPAAACTVNVLFYVVEELDEAHLARHVRRVVVECGPVQVGSFAFPSLFNSEKECKCVNLVLRREQKNSIIELL